MQYGSYNLFQLIIIITTFLASIILFSKEKRSKYWAYFYNNFIYQIRQSMSFLGNRPSFQENRQENYCNPIRQHLRRGKIKVGLQPMTELRFKDLSKDRPTYHSGTELSKDKSFKELLRRDSQAKIQQVKRRLQFDSSSNSMEKSMTFSDIIRLSRDKKLKGQSKLKKPNSKVTSSTSKQVKVFNALKNRLMGENNPNIANLQPSKSDDAKPLHLPSNEQLQMVRISSQFCTLTDSLSMRPF